MLECSYCKNQFKPKWARKKSSKNVYCSTTCFHEFKRINGTMTRGICAFCNKEFKRNKKQVDNAERSYCNRECYFSHKIELHKKIITCAGCGKEFSGTQKQLNRKSKSGNRYCSLICSNRYKKTDIYSPYRTTMQYIRASSKKYLHKEVKIGLEDLLEQFDKQEGKCPYTGWALILPETVEKANKVSGLMNRASLDRVDSSKGYTKDNIEWVSLMAQYAKNQWSKENLIQFCRDTTRNIDK